MVPQIRTKRLAYVHYQLPDIDQAAAFLNDFGMIEASRSGSKIYYRGFDTQPYIYIAEQSPTHERKFLGGTWVVESAQDLETAARHPQATPIRDNDGPGGGKVVTIKDPNGMLVSFISGQAPRARDGEEEINRRASGERAVPINSPLETTRVGQFQRFKPGPSPVFKLGHYGYIVPKSRYEETVAWYRELMNVTPSDIVYDPATGKDQSVFLHIDKGLDYSDHHSLFFSAGPEQEPTHVHHSSFEVNDFDTQSLGHYWLQEKGYTNCWGMGRHVLGSQIFDYWFDASGNVVEHYSDSDLVNKNSAVTREPAAHDTLHVWGPNVPLAFVTANMADAKPNLWVPDPRVVTKGEENGVNEVKHQANA